MVRVWHAARRRPSESSLVTGYSRAVDTSLSDSAWEKIHAWEEIHSEEFLDDVIQLYLSTPSCPQSSLPALTAPQSGEFDVYFGLDTIVRHERNLERAANAQWALWERVERGETLNDQEHYTAFETACFPEELRMFREQMAAFLPAASSSQSLQQQQQLDTQHPPEAVYEPYSRMAVSSHVSGSVVRSDAHEDAYSISRTSSAQGNEWPVEKAPAHRPMMPIVRRRPLHHTQQLQQRIVRPAILQPQQQSREDIQKDNENEKQPEELPNREQPVARCRPAQTTVAMQGTVNKQSVKRPAPSKDEKVLAILHHHAPPDKMSRLPGGADASRAAAAAVGAARAAVTASAAEARRRLANDHNKSWLQLWRAQTTTTTTQTAGNSLGKKQRSSGMRKTSQMQQKLQMVRLAPPTAAVRTGQRMKQSMAASRVAHASEASNHAPHTHSRRGRPSSSRPYEYTAVTAAHDAMQFDQEILEPEPFYDHSPAAMTGLPSMDDAFGLYDDYSQHLQQDSYKQSTLSPEQQGYDEQWHREESTPVYTSL